ncbi:hypothetical protein BX616_006886, partial [Lobosporangium transversale]
MFGPYLLLQTLGEGEFAKVKLGMHADSGEELLDMLEEHVVPPDPTVTIFYLQLQNASIMKKEA